MNGNRHSKNEIPPTLNKIHIFFSGSLWLQNAIRCVSFETKLKFNMFRGFLLVAIVIMNFLSIEHLVAEIPLYAGITLNKIYIYAVHGNGGFVVRLVLSGRISIESRVVVVQL